MVSSPPVQFAVVLVLLGRAMQYLRCDMCKVAIFVMCDTLYSHEELDEIIHIRFEDVASRGYNCRLEQ